MGNLLFLGPELQVADDSKWTESIDDLDEAVDGDNDDRVLDGVRKSLVVRGVRCVVSETDTGREENLSNGILPDLAACELLTVP